MGEDRTLILLGGGGHAAVVCDAARAAGWNVIGFLDDGSGPGPDGATRLGSLADLAHVARGHGRGVAIAVHAAFGDPGMRRRALDAAGVHAAAAIVHPRAVVSPSARIEEGAYVGPLAVVNARAVVGRGAIVNTAAVVEHDCKVGAFAHVAPRAVLAGAVTVGEDALVGAGATILPGTRIGRGATVGAGAVVIEDVADGACVMGVPARARRRD